MPYAALGSVMGTVDVLNRGSPLFYERYSCWNLNDIWYHYCVRLPFSFVHFSSSPILLELFIIFDKVGNHFWGFEIFGLFYVLSVHLAIFYDHI